MNNKTQSNQPKPPLNSSEKKDQIKGWSWNGPKGGAGHGRCDRYINPLTTK